MKMKNDALLEELAQRCGCLYLSDLRRPSAVNRMMILTTLQELNAEDYPLNQWMWVWLYLTDLPLPMTATLLPVAGRRLNCAGRCWSS